MEDLDNLFRKKIMGKLSSEEEKVKVYKDDLKRISKNFEQEVVENSLRGFSTDKQLFIVDLNKLMDNIKRISGVSIGSFFASIICMNFSYRDLIPFINI